MSEFPASWSQCKLGDVVDYGVTQKVEPTDIPADAWVLELEDIEKDTSKILQRFTFAQRQSKSTKNHFAAGDVLYGKLRPYLNKVVRADQDGFCTTEIIPLKPSGSVNRGYLFHWLKHPEFLKYVTAVSHGLNMPRLGTEAGIEAPFVLAPLNEQKRIADKLDTVLARVDACGERLDRVPAILKRFRQSVLAAATSGKLTEEWRTQHVARIQPQAESGIIETSDYISFPQDYDILPASWGWVSVEAICSVIVDCPHSTPKWSNSGEICLRTTNFRPGFLDLSEVYYVSSEVYQQRIARLDPQPGDVVYSREGGILGIACIIPSGIRVCLGQRMMLMRTNSGIYSSTLLMHVLNSPLILPRVRELTGGTASPHLNVRDIKAFRVPLPPIEEQHEIVRRVESLFTYADRLEARYTAARAHVERLTQALLAKAFRGELVPQDPNDEPAAVLLERIRAAREAAPAKSRQRKGGSQPTAACT